MTTVLSKDALKEMRQQWLHLRLEIIKHDPCKACKGTGTDNPFANGFEACQECCGDGFILYP